MATYLLVEFKPKVEFDPPEVAANPTGVSNDSSSEEPPPDNFPSDPNVIESPGITSDGSNAPRTIPPDSSQGTPDSSQGVPISGRWIRIPSSCNGFYAEGANFRVRPSLDVSAIRGAVLAGDSVFLTGETETDIDGNGITWYRALNELPLRLSADVENNSQHVLDANQEGWIAACFVES